MSKRSVKATHEQAVVLGIANAQLSTNALLHWLLRQNSILPMSTPAHEYAVCMNAFRAVQALYPKGKNRQSITLKKFSVLKEDAHALLLLKKLAEQSTHLFTDVLVHGSVATRETIQYWSDLDVLVIIKDDVFKDISLFQQLVRTAQKIERAIYAFDPYQHHGAQYIMEADLLFYPEYFLPVAVMRHGKSLFGTTRHTLYVRNSRLAARARFDNIMRTINDAVITGELHHHPRNNIYLKNNFELKKNSFYQLKYFISLVLLLPSLFIELVDEPILKKDSFNKISKYLTEEELELVRACERVRKLFKTTEAKNNNIPQTVIPILKMNYFERAQQLVQAMNAQL